MIIKGNVVKLGDNIDTDLIIPARYLQIVDINELKKHVFEDLDETLSKRIRSNTIIIGGENFGCGSSREQAPRVLKAAGTSAIIAKSFARIFFRNAINLGIPIFISQNASENIKDNSKVEIDTQKGTILDLSSKITYRFEPYPPFLENLIKKGGLIEFVKATLKK